MHDILHDFFVNSACKLLVFKHILICVLETHSHLFPTKLHKIVWWVTDFTQLLLQRAKQ